MKIRELVKELGSKNIDSAILINKESSYDSNVAYFSEINANGSCLLVKNDAMIFVPPLEYEMASKRCGFKVKNSGNKRLAIVLKEYVKKSKRIGVNFSAISLKRFYELKNDFKDKRFYDISEICRNIRMIKNKEEVKRIKKACKITDSVFELYLKNHKKLKNERDIVNFIRNTLSEFGAESSFKPIIASSRNASMPHYEICSSRIKRGFCIIDFGARYKNYCSDMTRTVFYGTPNKKDRELYGKVLNVQNNLVESIKSGMEAKYAYNSAKKQLEKLSPLFIHGLGHGIGVEVHEAPSLSRYSDDVLRDNMVFTIEPGIYKKNNFGIRIEDTVLLSKKCVQLTNSAKELIKLNL